jgi:hypothetical protein
MSETKGPENTIEESAIEGDSQHGRRDTVFNTGIGGKASQGGQTSNLSRN